MSDPKVKNDCLEIFEAGGTVYELRAHPVGAKHVKLHLLFGPFEYGITIPLEPMQRILGLLWRVTSDTAAGEGTR